MNGSFLSSDCAKISQFVHSLDAAYPLVGNLEPPVAPLPW